MVTEDPKDTSGEITKGNEEDHTQDSKVVSFLDYKIRKIDDEDLIQECLMLLKMIEIGMLNKEAKVRCKVLFSEAIRRPALEFIKNDFSIALKILDKVFPDNT